MMLSVLFCCPQNKRRAFRVLRARLMDLIFTKNIAERRATRQNLVRTADRSEKTRTHNYAQATQSLLPLPGATDISSLRTVSLTTVYTCH
jgi:hypothetical protein